VLRKRTMTRAFVRAGHRDTDASTIFDKIVAKEIPSTVGFEDEKVSLSLACVAAGTLAHATARWGRGS
jgi:hypothetical protein